MAEDIDFKYPLKRACTSEIQTHCANVQHGHANVIRFASLLTQQCIHLSQLVIFFSFVLSHVVLTEYFASTNVLLYSNKMMSSAA